MNNIPNELYLKIFKLLEKKELKTVRLISKRCKDISNLLIFSRPNIKRKIKLTITQIAHLPILTLDNRYLKRFITVDTFPGTVNTVLLSQRKPIVPPETISRYPNIEFFISLGYLYPKNILHESTYALLANVKLYSCSSSSIRYKLLNKYDNFNFRYLNISHLETFSTETFTADEGISILSQLKIERVVLLKSRYFRITLDQLLQISNIVCISSDVFNGGLFPLKIIQEIESLETIFIESRTTLHHSELKELKALFHSPFHYFWTGERDIVRFFRPCCICIKQPRCALGKPFPLPEDSSLWLYRIYGRYFFAG